MIAVDPHPHRRWTPTYSAWLDELPGWLDPSAIAVTVPGPAVWTTRRQEIERTYCVLDTAGLQASLELDGVDVRAQRADDLTATTVRLDDGTTLRGRHVVDARGTPAGSELAEQTAFGVVLSRSAALPLLDGAGAWFMDWRRDNGAPRDATPSFLYVVPLSDEQVLVEETCLVGRPALGLPELHIRLKHRLGERGIDWSDDAPIERVRFSVQPPPVPPRQKGRTIPTRFGSRADLMHPATGYSVAASLATVDAMVSQLGTSTSTTSPSVWMVQRLRNLGLRTALNLTPELVPEFFASFFALPVDLQRAYLSGRSDARGTMTAMLRMFPTLPTGARAAIARTVLDRGSRA